MGNAGFPPLKGATPPPSGGKKKPKKNPKMTMADAYAQVADEEDKAEAAKGQKPSGREEKKEHGG